jgi:hypothetical protein
MTISQTFLLLGIGRKAVMWGPHHTHGLLSKWCSFLLQLSYSDAIGMIRTLLHTHIKIIGYLFYTPAIWLYGILTVAIYKQEKRRHSLMGQLITYCWRRWLKKQLGENTVVCVNFADFYHIKELAISRQCISQCKLYSNIKGLPSLAL